MEHAPRAHCSRAGYHPYSYLVAADHRHVTRPAPARVTREDAYRNLVLDTTVAPGHRWKTWPPSESAQSSQRAGVLEVNRVIQDDLNTYVRGSFCDAFEPSKARRLLRKLEFHYT